MDTTRINIINQDMSSGATSAAVTLKGFTVVKAEKGPVEPVFIPAGNTAMIHDVLGYTSSEYPAIQEVIDFNKEYGLYVSAPYDAATSKVPVAYITPAGILASSTPVTLGGQRLEDVALGDALVEGINTFAAADPTVLIPVGKENSYFNASGTDVADVLTFDAGTSKLLINLGFSIAETSLQTNRAIFHFLNKAGFAPGTGRVLQASTSGNANEEFATLVFDIPGQDLIELQLVNVEGTSYDVQDIEGHSLCTVDKTSTTSIALTGGDDASLPDNVKAYFSPSAILSTWSDDTFRKTVKVYWKASLAKEAIYGSVYPKYPSARSTTLTFPKQYLGNKITFAVAEQVTPSSYSTATITGSLVDQDVDGFGASLSFQERLADQNLISVHVEKSFDGVVYTKTATTTAPQVIMQPVVLSRGVRAATADLELGWEEAKAPEYDDVEVFFSSEAINAQVATAFTDVANVQKLSRFVAAQHVAPEAATESLPQLIYGANYFITTNSFYRKSSYSRQDYESPLTGAYAAMILRAVSLKMGGAAPMFLNSGGIGGQLGVSVRKARFRYTKEQLAHLDAAGYNPIIMDPAYGVMVVGQKTAKGGELSDWSYIGHTSAFLAFQRQVRDNVLVPQIGKPNNPYYRDLRKSQVENILRPRIEGTGRIWAQAAVDTSEATVNTRAVQAAYKFVVKVKVRVDIFSEEVELIMMNVDQYTDVTTANI